MASMKLCSHFFNNSSFPCTPLEAMPSTCTSENGLLLLLRAAKKIDEDDGRKKPHLSDCWDTRISRHQRNEKFSSNSSSYNQRKLIGNTNRAHLRTCMEELKDQLHFENDAPRITMLNVLKKATSTINNLKNENKRLFELEERQKQKSSQLFKKRNNYRKKIEQRLHSRKIQNWRERNRNYSECSVATTSSEDSELECHTRPQRMVVPGQIYINNLSNTQRPLTPKHFSTNSSNITLCNGDMANVLRSCQTSDEISPGAYRMKQRALLSAPSSAGTSPPPSSAFSTTSNMCSMDTFDGSSLDSGYEETVGHNVNISANDLVSTETSGKCLNSIKCISKVTSLSNATKLHHVQQSSAECPWTYQGNVQLAAESVAYL